MQQAYRNIHTITASSFQLEESDLTYQPQSDAASRNRVWEALNAGLKALPDWPEPLRTNGGVTVEHDAQLRTQTTQQELHREPKRRRMEELTEPERMQMPVSFMAEVRMQMRDRERREREQEQERKREREQLQKEQSQHPGLSGPPSFIPRWGV